MLMSYLAAITKGLATTNEASVVTQTYQLPSAEMSLKCLIMLTGSYTYSFELHVQPAMHVLTIILPPLCMCAEQTAQSRWFIKA